MSKNAAPYTVVIEEVRRKKVVIWGDGGADAGWKALDLLSRGIIRMDGGVEIKNTVTSIRESNDVELKHLEQFCGGCYV